MISMKFEGGVDIAKALSDLSDRLSKKILMDALKTAAEPMRAAAEAHAPRGEKPPHIAANIVISPARSQEEQAAVNIGPAKTQFAYGLPLEIGTIHMQAQPFMRPAFDESITATLSIASDEMWQALTKRGFSRPGSTDAPDRGDE